MDLRVQEKVLYSVMNAPMMHYPSPLFAQEGVFPEDFYNQLLENIPPKEAFVNINEAGYLNGYEGQDVERYVINLKTDQDKLEGKNKEFWSGVYEFLGRSRFVNAVVDKFRPYVVQRFGPDFGKRNWSFQLKLLKDLGGYSLGPHTDSEVRALNVFFYLPQDNKRPELGTSFYVPREVGFTCNRGDHYEFKDFINIYTAPYKRNTVAGFFRTPKSFHGVEPVTGKIERHALALSVAVKG